MSPPFNNLSRGAARCMLIGGIVFASACTLDAGGGLPPEISLIASSVASATTTTSGTATITNAFDRRRFQSGILIGTVSDSSLNVDISLDGGAYSSATINGTNWSFALPAGANTWKLNTSHTIALRLTNSTGSALNETTITVYKDINRDVNRDGYADLAVGSYEFMTETGRAYLFHGSSSGLKNGSGASANAILDGTATGDRFSFDLTLGDINGDGYADLVAGSPNYSASNGRVSIYYGNDQGLTGATNHHIGGIGGNFGQTVRVADVNGDGYDDVIASAPTGAAGTVYIFHGGASGVTATTPASANTMITGESAGDNLGNGLAFGDFNGDGFADIAMGADSCCTSDGKAYIKMGSAGGIPSSAANVGSSIITGEGGTGGRLGVSLVAADFNGDGFSDLALGAFSFSSNAGRAYVFHGSGSGIASAGAASAQSIVDGDAASTAGRRMAAGDLNADGYTELILGGSGFNTSTGRVFVFSGSGSGIPSGGSGVAQILVDGEAMSGLLGHSVTVSDLNADGYGDLICGAPGLFTNTGRTYILNGSGSFLNSTSALTADRFLAGESTTSLFGYSMR